MTIQGLIQAVLDISSYTNLGTYWVVSAVSVLLSFSKREYKSRSEEDWLQLEQYKYNLTVYCFTLSTS